MPEKSFVDEPRFQRFVLSLEARDSGYRARARNESVDLAPWTETADGEPSSEPSSDEPDRDVRRRSSSRDNLVATGRRLFDWVFRGAVGQAFREAMLQTQRGGLTLCVELDEAPELGRLPWEALWDSRENKFLIEYPHLVIARTLKKVPKRDLGPATRRALQLCALIPEPENLPKLSGSKEWAFIRDELRKLEEKGLVETETLEPATLGRLDERVRTGGCDVLHVAAHGEPGPSDQMGLIYLEDGLGCKEKVTGVDLATVFGHADAPRLVVLNACHGAGSRADEAYDGLAQHLLRQGVAAVVAMRTSISDKAAVRFAGSLYKHLAAGATVESAVSAVRRELAVSPERGEWPTPVLYLGSDHVRLVEPPSSLVSDRGLLRRATAGGLLVALAGLGWWSVSPGGPFHEIDRCPPMPGLEEMRFAYIEGNTVRLGDELVAVGDFCIGTHEVTRKLWKKVMSEEPGGEGKENWPATHMTHAQARQFTELLSQQDRDHTYRLPTEAEWMLAARGGTETLFHFGDDEAALDQYGNCKNFLGQDCHDGPAPVGSYEPNPFGLYDVHGNVAEWTAEILETVNGDQTEVDALSLGGSFTHIPENCSFKPREPRWILAADTGREETGFRVLREIRDEPSED